MQYKSNKCINKRQLRFDFAIFEDEKIKFLIEYDGIGHFKSQTNWGGESAFLKQKENDNIKDQYCQDNDIILLRIPYWKKENISQILLKEIGGEIGYIPR